MSDIFALPVPAAPVGPVAPVDPVGAPEGPVAPAVPVAPVGPVGPPEGPVGPVGPVGAPEGPVGPVIGLVHTTPVPEDASTCPTLPPLPLAVNTPEITGLVMAGLWLNTKGPVPVSSGTNPAKLAEFGVARNVDNGPVTPCTPAESAVL